MVVRGPALLAVLRGPAANPVPAGALPGVEHESGVRGVPAVAVHRDDLTGAGGDAALEAVADVGDAVVRAGETGGLVRRAAHRPVHGFVRCSGVRATAIGCRGLAAAPAEGGSSTPRTVAITPSPRHAVRLNLRFLASNHGRTAVRREQMWTRRPGKARPYKAGHEKAGRARPIRQAQPNACGAAKNRLPPTTLCREPFTVCSRRVRLLPPPDTSHWDVTRHADPRPSVSRPGSAGRPLGPPVPVVALQEPTGRTVQVAGLGTVALPLRLRAALLRRRGRSGRRRPLRPQTRPRRRSAGTVLFRQRARRHLPAPHRRHQLDHGRSARPAASGPQSRQPGLGADPARRGRRGRRRLHR